jgi:hypothetical protein
MVVHSTGPELLQRVLQRDLRQPLWLTRAEAAGGWTVALPDLARLPIPYPIYGQDEEAVLTYGFPVLVTPAVEQLRRELGKHLVIEVDFRLSDTATEAGDKRKVMVHRERSLRSLTAIFENVLLNDYGRGLTDVLLLFLSGELSRLLQHVPAMATTQGTTFGRQQSEPIRWAIVSVFADLLQRAFLAAGDELKRLAAAATKTPSALVSAVCQDQLLLAEAVVPPDIDGLAEYVRTRLRGDCHALVAARNTAFANLREVLERVPSFEGVVHMALGAAVSLDRPQVLHDARLLEALRRAGLTERIGLSSTNAQVLGELGQRLKRFEVLAALRRRVLTILSDGPDLRLVSRTGKITISRSLRPFDFTRPGVVDTAVKRFGMIYDLTDFTAVLEEVRKRGQSAEEKALRFMFAFLSRLEEIRQRRRLTFEKFLGDGAFYSSRRALRMIAAACEMQQVYDQLRHRGFPFDQGIRCAMNCGTYHLLPLPGDDGTSRFEFFGHSVVELVRLTTGKSVREVDEIAEFLVHSGFDPAQVDSFLAPLVMARGGRRELVGQPYPAWIDAHGELVNEGIVVSIPFLEELNSELKDQSPKVVEAWDQPWAVFPTDPGKDDTLWFGLRYLGVARLKGLPPLELVAAATWPQLPAGARPASRERTLLELLRRLDAQRASEPPVPSAVVPDDLVVVTFLDDSDRRTWVFGQYRNHDDVLLHSIQVPLQPPDLERGEPLEMWLFRHRSELAQLYDTLRRETSGRAQPLESLRRRNSYLGCYLAAPHRSPS